ncbi:MAG TPA: hypothetical protein VHZ03_29990 [Trebonia sp.]|nr:hypothetical protein [Trebonia sp.]
MGQAQDMNDQPARPGYGLAYIRQVQAGRSPVSDLIDKHRAEMARIWERHVEELRNPARAA